MKTANQVDGANDEDTPENSTKKIKRRKKKSPVIEISLQLDGTGPPVGDEEEEDEDSELEGVSVRRRRWRLSLNETAPSFRMIRLKRSMTTMMRMAPKKEEKIPTHFAQMTMSVTMNQPNCSTRRTW